MTQTDKIPAKKKLTTVVYLLISMIVGILALWYCFRNIKFDEFIEDLKSVNYFYIGLSISFGFFAFIIRALRWNILINTLGYKPSVYDSYNAVVVAYISNLAIPRIGEITRCATLYKTNKIPVTSLFGTVVTERVIDLISLIVITTLVFLLKMDFVVKNIVPQWESMLQKTSTGMLLLLAVAAIVFAIVVYIVIKQLLKRPSMHKFKEMFDGLLEGLKSVFKMQKKFHFIGYTVVIWTCYWLNSYLVMLALPSTASLTAIDGLLLMVLGSMGWVIPVPGGVGVFHSIVAWGLMMYGLDFEQGVIFATLSHESQLLMMVFFGIIALISVSLTQNKLNQK
ncbi:MAG: flippase-like domain-containing protein [Prevotellaceae bacterium]|jgi:uncharacterized protein (TIRG00374 family)|nr:flippase-like domain-containing protein [Prevotellaceae bacterium]